MTMTQMAAAFCSLINGGYYYEPHVVKQIRDADGKVIETKDPVLLRKTVSKETSDQLKTYLKATMEYGTGMSAAVEGYDIRSKNRNSRKTAERKWKAFAFHIGYAPQEESGDTGVCCDR